MNNISPQAHVDPKAKIGNNVTIYPFAYIEGDVVIGDDCVIYPYVSIMKGTRLGRGNKVYQNTVLGAEPQDFNYKGEVTALEIGDENIIRENVVINRATYATGKTHIGNRNFLMEGVHISHDTKIGNFNVFGYGTKIAASGAQPGDLFFYAKNGTINHVAIYIGNGQVVHASSPRTGIKISNAYYRTPATVRRILP